MDNQNVEKGVFMDSIIFDVDGTLWDSTFVVAKAWDEVAKREYDPNINITAELLKCHFGKLLPDIGRAIFTKAEESEALRLTDVCCEAEHEALLATPPDVYSGMRETLAKLSEKYPLFIVSNCQAGYIEVFLQATGLGKYFQDHLCPGDTGVAKAENIKEIVRRNNLKDAVYVGDTMGDYRATKEAGLPFIFASYGFGEVSTPDYTINQPLDLLKFL